MGRGAPIARGRRDSMARQRGRGRELLPRRECAGVGSVYLWDAYKRVKYRFWIDVMADISGETQSID